MKVKIISLFPEAVEEMLKIGVIGKALKKGLWSLECVNLKDFGPHIDDRPFGGGAGMIIKAEVLEKALKNSENIFFTSPRGKLFNQKLAQEYSKFSEITILCGRYEGIDQRIINHYKIQEISIGEYVLCGGESAACVILEGILRLLPNVLNNENSIINESFSSRLLEHDHYTFPKIWKDYCVPDVLFTGNHSLISDAQYFNSLEITYKNEKIWKQYQCYFICYLCLYVFLTSKKKRFIFNKH